MVGNLFAWCAFNSFPPANSALPSHALQFSPSSPPSLYTATSNTNYFSLGSKPRIFHDSRKPNLIPPSSLIRRLLQLYFASRRILPQVQTKSSKSSLPVATPPSRTLCLNKNFPTHISCHSHSLLSATRRPSIFACHRLKHCVSFVLGSILCVQLSPSGPGVLAPQFNHNNNSSTRRALHCHSFEFDACHPYESSFCFWSLQP